MSPLSLLSIMPQAAPSARRVEDMILVGGQALGGAMVTTGTKRKHSTEYNLFGASGDCGGGTGDVAD